MFARYAYAPNQLGYCGPADARALHNGSSADIRALARQFSGAWPYLRAMSRLTGITDPLDRRLVESYWLGGGIGADLDADAFTTELLAIIGPMAGHYWSYLNADLAEEAAANHGFHVFGVYPWTRLLGRGADEHPIRILDSCRITWGTVVARDGGAASVRCRRLVLDGPLLRLSAPALQRAEVDDQHLATEVTVGDQVAVHWGRVCGRLDAGQARALAISTARQLQVTNRRLTDTLRNVRP
ncbi:DUF6390 family protein [Nocardia rhizosphaerihabitans]|uniref:Uncharacterized protein n=1 Tax=Nocardia rhizosphaerihabitans TaxID=1691570 RepID=A0ABQ2KHP1_9NOCA|nr:DUF6390 family protein [Nocardia rhizosphaerihabitans]GGN82948.1 hypothetical protein GCM10011610_34890 [Nocardia rhizosphaerihabitans]